MDKSIELQQFENIQKDLCAYLNTHEISTEKSKKAILGYNYIWELVDQHAKSKGLDPTKYILWLIFRSLSQAEYLPIKVEKCILSSLDFNEAPKPKRLHGSDNGLRAYLSVFGTEQQRRILNAQ